MHFKQYSDSVGLSSQCLTGIIFEMNRLRLTKKMKLAWFIVAIVYISSGEVRSKTVNPTFCPANGYAANKACILVTAHSQEQVNLAENHVPRSEDKASTAYNNIYDTCNGRSAALSSAKVCACARGGFVCLDLRIVEYILELQESFPKIQVFEVAGGCNCNTELSSLVVTAYNAGTKIISMCTKQGGQVLFDSTVRLIHCRFDGYVVMQ